MHRMTGYFIFCITLSSSGINTVKFRNKCFICTKSYCIIIYDFFISIIDNVFRIVYGSAKHVVTTESIKLKLFKNIIVIIIDIIVSGGVPKHIFKSIQCDFFQSYIFQLNFNHLKIFQNRFKYIGTILYYRANSYNIFGSIFYENIHFAMLVLIKAVCLH